MITPIGERPEDTDLYEWIKCDCPCHDTPGVMHIVACCENGWLKVPKVAGTRDFSLAPCPKCGGYWCECMAYGG